VLTEVHGVKKIDGLRIGFGVQCRAFFRREYATVTLVGVPSPRAIVGAKPHARFC